MNGVWIALEGGDASGKSTQARLLADRLDALLSWEPGRTELGRRIRDALLDAAIGDVHPRAEALLVAADRAQHTSEVVRPALEAGRTVVTDRSALSSLAYQGYGRGLDLNELRHFSDWASCGWWPSLVVLLDVAEEVRKARFIGGEADRLERAGDDFHRRVHDGYLALAAASPERWVVVDGSGAVEDVAARVDAAVDAWLAVHA